MPLYDFRCAACGHRFEEFAAAGDAAPCPACGSSEPVERVYNSFAGPFTVTPRGSVARRSNAVRAGREEQRREEFGRGREARAQGEAPPARRTDDTPWWRKVPGGP
jgi:putative FmdB family regulatory protein